MDSRDFGTTTPVFVIKKHVTFYPSYKKHRPI